MPPEPATSRHAAAVDALCQAVLQSPGDTDPALRLAAYRGAGLPAPVDRLVRKVHDASERTTDADVQALLASGLSQDAVFELTVAAALGAAMQRLEAGLRPLSARK